MRIFTILFILCIPITSQSWGFFAHKAINRLAVFTLPPEMIAFYKAHITYITEKSINPDRRRYAVKAEAARHYIDVDIYGDSAIYKMPRYWKQAVALYSEDTLQTYGIVPYHIGRMANWLIKAFENKDVDQILKLSTEIGHYIADANVPLHTTENYNGQLTGQYGIHGFWESRLPELFIKDYNLLTGQAQYIENLQLKAWDAVIPAHEALDSVLLFEKKLTKKYSESKKYGYEEKNNSMIRTYTYNFSKDYHKMLNGMVERRMRSSIKMIGDFWFSCWVKAGQPNLDELVESLPILDSTFVKNAKVKTRQHEGK